jgi:hypothetical protein
MTDYGPLTEDDLRYIREQFATLEALCAGRKERPYAVRALIREGVMPEPTYVLDDGTEMFPPGYFALLDDAGGVDKQCARFYERYARMAGSGTQESEIAEEWEGYLSGVYGVCLVQASPENICEKEALVKSLGALLAEPRLEDLRWRTEVRREVTRLDELEREFAPCDRKRFGGSVSRDRLITATRARYPSIFAPRAGDLG